MSFDETISQGRSASFLLRSLAPRLQQHERKIVDRLVGKYYSGKLTHDELYGGVAAISEMRSFVRDLELDRKKGEQALAEERKS